MRPRAVTSGVARQRVLCAALGLALAACGDVTTPLIAAPTDSGIRGQPQDGATPDDGGGDGGDAATNLPCGDHPCACDDGADQDSDGLIDGLDPECTGPLDDDEATFGTGRDDAIGQACQDCFWDENSDARDDGCAYPRSCTEPGTVSGDDALACSECSVTARCESQCEKRTPNGCDCFGCCTVTRTNGSTVNVLLQGAGCSIANVDDVQACKRCEPSPDCRKECGECELCLGRKRRDIAKTCKGKPSDPDQTPVCDDGETPCSATEPCDSLFYCHQGCCLVRVL